jgi:hypothetical protein
MGISHRAGLRVNYIQPKCGLPTALPQAPVMRAGEVCHMLPQATILVLRIRRFQARLEATGCPS